MLHNVQATRNYMVKVLWCITITPGVRNRSVSICRVLSRQVFCCMTILAYDMHHVVIFFLRCILLY